MPAPTPLRKHEPQDLDRAVLLNTLRRYKKMSEEGQSGRNASDRKGAKFARSEMWDGGVSPGKLPITSNLALALTERLNSQLTRNKPAPLIEAINAGNDDAAALLQGGVSTAWTESKMQEKAVQGQHQASFTRACGWYTYWRSSLRGGIGDMDTRLIPGWRLIIDDRHLHSRDMEFIGFSEPCTRAKLISLFPDKAEEIEEAGSIAAIEGNSPGRTGDPLRPGARGGAESLDRNVLNQPKAYLGKTSVSVGKNVRALKAGLAQEVQPCYMWIDDPTPEEYERPKLSALGQPMYELVRHPETNEVQFDHEGWEPIDSPIGPILQPKLKPKKRRIMETAVRKKYAYWRHVAWIPEDDIILWDVAWNGPPPLAIQRDTIPISGFHSVGRAQRLCDLGLARNILLTILFARLRQSMGGTWLATQRSGLKTNKLSNEPGLVYQVREIEGQVKNFPVDPIDAAYFNLLDKIEAEMGKLLNVSDVQQGQAVGRADSPQTYDKLIEQGGGPVVSLAQLLEETIRDWTTIQMWFMQNYYTHEHYVELENADGQTTWRAASALAVQGEFAVRMETGSQVAYSPSLLQAQAEKGAALGFYPLPMLGKLGHFPMYRQGLKMKMDLLRKAQSDPVVAQALLGASGAPPTQASRVVQNQGRRSHHAPGGR